jgi:hypothetical protein
MAPADASTRCGTSSVGGLTGSRAQLICSRSLHDERCGGSRSAGSEVREPLGSGFPRATLLGGTRVGAGGVWARAVRSRWAAARCLGARRGLLWSFAGARFVRLMRPMSRGAWAPALVLDGRGVCPTHAADVPKRVGAGFGSFTGEWLLELDVPRCVGRALVAHGRGVSPTHGADVPKRFGRSRARGLSDSWCRCPEARGRSRWSFTGEWLLRHKRTRCPRCMGALWSLTGEPWVRHKRTRCLGGASAPG